MMYKIWNFYDEKNIMCQITGPGPQVASKWPDLHRPGSGFAPARVLVGIFGLWPFSGLFGISYGIFMKKIFGGQNTGPGPLSGQ